MLYYLNTANSTLSGGTHFNKVLGTSPDGAGSATIAISANQANTSFGFTNVGAPNMEQWNNNGPIPVQVNITTASADIQLSISISRISSTGTVLQTTPATSEESLRSTGTYLFEVPNIDWAAGSSTDRLRVNYHFRNSHAMQQRSVVIQTGVLSSYIDLENIFPAVYYDLTVTREGEGTVTPSVGTHSYKQGASVTLSATPATGWRFVRWLIDGSTIITNASTQITMNSDRTVHAVFEVATYTVTFRDWDGTILKTETVVHGGSATPPPDPVREGRTFIGWSHSYTNVTSNVVTTAQYSFISPWNGSGTEQDPYIITTVEELQLINTKLDGNFALGNDIDASDTVNWNNGAGFVPIGRALNSFTGSFDGKGHVVRGVYINSTNDKERLGLFGSVIGTALKYVVIKNVSLKIAI